MAGGVVGGERVPGAGGMSGTRPRLVYVVTVADTADAFLRGQLSHMVQSGYDVSLIAAPSPLLDEVGKAEGVSVHPVAMERSISPIADLQSIRALARLLGSLRPDIVNYGTPKAGLLTGIAAALRGVPLRVYTVHGLRFEGARGFRRFVLAAAEAIACRTAHRVVCVSPSVRRCLVEQRFVAPARATVLGAGSCNGIDATRYAPADTAARAAARRELGIAPGIPVVGFVGRMTRDKGVADLVAAFRALRTTRRDLTLLLVGDNDGTDPLPDDVRKEIDGHPGILLTGWIDDPRPYYACMDVFVLPSYREGLPQVVLEASAAALPVVATDATGVRDAIVDGATGLRTRRANVPALTEAIGRVLDDPTLARRLGDRGRRTVQRRYEPKRVWSALTDLYRAPAP